MTTRRTCEVEPFRYQATPQPDAGSGASANQINEQSLEDYLNRFKEAVCADIDSIIAECCGGGGDGGAETFLELTDTPASYAGAGSRFVAVNAGANALEFVAAPSGGGGGLHKDFSTSEQATDRTWIGGETIYQKTINVGTLPNTATKNVAHGITGLAYVILFTGWAKNATESIPIPFTNILDINSVQVQSNSTNLRVTTGINRTAFTTCYVTMFYVKTP